jgi:hypothetical protein
MGCVTDELGLCWISPFNLCNVEDHRSPGSSVCVLRPLLSDEIAAFRDATSCLLVTNVSEDPTTSIFWVQQRNQAEAVMFLSCIRVVPGSSLGLNTDNPHLFVVFLSPSMQIWDIALNYTYGCVTDNNGVGLYDLIY